MAVNLFDVNFYRFANADLAGAGLTTDAQLTNHFQAFGLNEGRRFSAVADANFYRASNPDLTASGLSSNAQLLDHMQRYGVAEGRSFSAFVNLNFYLASNPDVNSAVGGNREIALNHLRTYGIGEGRSFSEFVDVNAYLNYNPDVKQAYSGNRVQGLNHLEVYGVNEGRQFSPFVDLIQYLANNADLKQAFGSNRTLALNHLEINGINEGRRFAAGFDVNYYRAANSGLASAGVNTNLLAYRHWVQYGFNEGRVAIADPGFGNYSSSPNGSAGAAAKIGPLTQGHTAVLSGTVIFSAGQTLADYQLTLDDYQFTIDKTSIVSVHNLKNSTSKVTILDSFGSFKAASSALPGSNSTAVLLAPGTYYFRAEASVASTTQQYAVSLEASAPVGVDALDLAGNGFDSALNLSLRKNEHFHLSGVRNSVSTSDQDDFYKVNLSSSGTLQINMAPFGGDADLYIYDANKTLLTGSFNSGTTFESKTLTLAQGTYYVDVKSFGGVNNVDYDFDLELN